MRKYFFVLSIILLASFNNLIGQELLPGKVDFTGVDKFWGIQELLKKDKNPTELAWNDLFSTPCYEYITKSTSREKLVRRFQIAYMPGKQDVREELLSKGGYNARVLNHLISIDDVSKTKIQLYADSLKSVDFFGNAVLLTAEYLPEKFISKNKELYPPIAFGVFEPDGRAGSIIALDIAFTRNIDFNKFLAHEAHHFFMRKIRREIKKAENPNLEYLFKTIRQLHLEGIADLIDKRELIAKPKDITEQDDWYAYHYNRYFNSAKNTMQKMDSLISADSELQENTNGRAIWKLLHFGTHPEAMHMALLIESTFGKSHIINILDNPFEIFWSYQKAALKNPKEGHIFSERTINYLKELEQDYLINE